MAHPGHLLGAGALMIPGFTPYYIDIA